MSKGLSTDSYKGVRDFYPDDMTVQSKIFSIWRDIARRYGYEEYNASVLEPADLYRAKSGEEIVNEQTYTFTDRGDREVTLRPEMTPTVARMVAAKRRELSYPLRWYSIPNLFRYESPQRGRLREHWQLNVDVFGIESTRAEVEIIQIACDITKSYGLKDENFEVRVNSRKLMDYVSRDVFGLSEIDAHAISKLIDRKDKMPQSDFEKVAKETLGEKTRTFVTMLNSKNFEEFISHLPQTSEEHQGIKEVREVISALDALGIRNARFDQTLMRGFDYYTGVVFEVFDKNPNNRRSIFGGGRYDDLLSIFGGDKVPAVGFGAGDVVARDLMETYGTLPTGSSPADVCLCVMDEKVSPYADELAQVLRRAGIRVAVDYTGKKVGDQIKNADKKKIPRVIVIGDEEKKTGTMSIKTLDSGEEKKVKEEDLVTELLK
jgi:histidyl-tRNA synthetase